MIKRIWLLLLLIQIVCIAVFMHNRDSVGIYNTDAFSYHLHWSKIASTFDPFSEPVLSDPGHDIKRIPFSIPHTVFGVTTYFAGPVNAYLLWCCLGVLTTYFSTYLFCRALGFANDTAHFLSAIHYIFYHFLSQLPPLSVNQLNYIADFFQIDPENVLHLGPRQYPHDIFFYPLLYTILALTLIGVKKIKRGDMLPLPHLLGWMFLCFLLPFNYLYHWFEYACMLFMMFFIGIMLKWWAPGIFLNRYRTVSIITGLILIWWMVIIVFQNSQLSSPEGYYFSLMSGLTEARFVLLPAGLVLRILVWMALLVVVHKINPNSVLLCVFLVSCLVLMNMQLVVGKNIQPGHWSFGVDKVFAWIVILILAAFTNRYFSLYKKQIRLAGLIIAVTFFGIQNWFSWRNFERMSRWDRERTDVIAYLKKIPPAVVLVPEIWLETDVLIHTHHRSFLPRAAQSALSQEEHLQRITHAALLLGYSEAGFLKWIHIRSIRFFGMLYRTEKEFSSSLYYDDQKRPEVLKFQNMDLPLWDKEIISEYVSGEVYLQKTLDLVVLHHCEPVPENMTNVLFRNSKYLVGEVSPLKIKEWGGNLPVEEHKYPVIPRKCKLTLN